jgi:ribosomal protein L11 methyltransferase
VVLQSPALVIRFPDGHRAALRDRLVALLADHDLIAIHEDRIDEPRGWTAHFGTPAARDGAAAAIASSADFADLRIQPVEIDDEDWARRTQADLPAVTIGRVTIAPPWDLPRPAVTPGFLRAATPAERLEPANLLVIIEPSRGFGTGHHQSTRLCVALLQSREVTGRTVTDVGTGSGVLAITAAKLGAQQVLAFDSDPDAVENARENIATNEVGQRVSAIVDDLGTTQIPAADLVLANLTGTLLAHHAADLARLVRRGGAVIASGFNLDERGRVSDALAPFLEISESAEEDDWHAFVLTPSARR